MKVLGYGEVMAKYSVPSVCEDKNKLISNHEVNALAFGITDKMRSFGGTEANVMINLRKLGVETTLITAFGEDKMSLDCINELKRNKVNLIYDTIPPYKMGFYYYLTNENIIKRTLRTEFFRKNSAINHLTLNKFQIEELFNDVSLFHISGIALSLDDKEEGIASKNGLILVKEACKRKIPVSFDFNYRGSIYSEYKEEGPLRFKKAISEVINYATIMLLSSKDLKVFLDYDYLNEEEEFNLESLKRLQKEFFIRFPLCKWLVIRDRLKEGPNLKKNENSVKYALITRDEIRYNPTNVFSLIESVGGGDAFDAGIIYGYLNYHDDLIKTLTLGDTLFKLKHNYVHDYFETSEFLTKGVNLKMKILLQVDSILDEAFIEMKKNLDANYDVTFTDKPIDSLKGYDVFIGKKLDENILDTADKLHYVFAYKTGVDDFPLKKLNMMGVKLYNSHADSQIIAKYAFALATSLCCRISEFDTKMRHGVWYDYERENWVDISTLKIGLLGFGSIGQAINKLLVMNKIDTYTLKRHEDNYYHDVKLVNDFNVLIKTCDMIICSLPKTDDTNTLFNKEVLFSMKDKYLVNVGRSNCIDEEALYEVLKERVMAGAAIDTWLKKKPKNSNEPFYPSKYPLHELDNIILSPHQAMKVASGHKNYVIDITNTINEVLLKGHDINKVDLNKGY